MVVVMKVSVVVDDSGIVVTLGGVGASVLELSSGSVVVGSAVGSSVGSFVGFVVGSIVGSVVGSVVGCSVVDGSDVVFSVVV
jgi:penicillin-binding protein 1C